jgi:hypothetical protein
MNSKTLVGAGAVAAVAAAIFALQSFNAEEVACEDIAEARASLEATRASGVDAAVQVYADEKAQIDERLSQCLSAKPVDPCADAQAARDAAVAGFNGIASPADDAPYAEFQAYFAKRDDAYAKYKSAKDALDQCRAANPPKADVPYEQSDTKACFDEYDAAVETARSKFETDTQAMRAALAAALAALDAREKACNPPTGDDKFTESIGGAGGEGGMTAVELQNCLPLDPEADAEIRRLRLRAAAIPGEIELLQTTIDNARKRMSPLQTALRDVDTYIPPEATKTQFEGALNALRAERKVALEASVGFYENLIARKQAEKAALEAELRDVQAKIQARLAQIQKENEARQRAFPTNLHLAKPDKCEYYHCHGLLCGRPDPAADSCGHGATTEDDVECEAFLEAYLERAGV